MKKLLFILFAFCSLITKSQEQTYIISRYEQAGDQLFICITSPQTPNYIEHFFTSDEKIDSTTIKSTIAILIAQLQLSDSLYVPPVPVINRIQRAKKYKIDPNVVKDKLRRLERGQPKVKALNSLNSEVIDSIITDNPY